MCRYFLSQIVVLDHSKFQEKHNICRVLWNKMFMWNKQQFLPDTNRTKLVIEKRKNFVCFHFPFVHPQGTCFGQCLWIEQLMYGPQTSNLVVIKGWGSVTSPANVSTTLALSWEWITVCYLHSSCTIWKGSYLCRVQCYLERMPTDS